jgi:CBS domain containing-hemolysin-like protein
VVAVPSSSSPSSSSALREEAALSRRFVGLGGWAPAADDDDDDEDDDDEDDDDDCGEGGAADAEEDDDGNIRPFADNGFLVKALTTIEDFNEHFGTYYDETEFDTIGGIVTQQFGHLPAKDEKIQIGELIFQILAADNRRIRLMQVNPVSVDANEPAPQS